MENVSLCADQIRAFAPEGTLFVAESGIKTAADVQMLRECGVNGILIGETLMRAPDRRQALKILRGSL